MACYRCGWCGQPTDADGNVLSLEAIVEISGDWDKAESTPGECCRGEQENNKVQVTREMAMDAGMPEMEGAWIDW